MSASARGVWIALPTYNERENLEPLVQALLGIAPDAQILIIDDNSPDGTGLLAAELARVDPRIRVLHRPGKEGLGVAYRAAFDHLLADPGCQVVVQMDCDFSHDPGDVPRLLAALASGADLALGSRYAPGGSTPGWGIGRRLISRGGSLFARIVLGVGVRDLTGGFKAWRADLLRSLDVASVETRGYGFQIEMTWRAHRAGAAIREIPITFHERRAGSSKMSRRIVVEALLMVVRMRFARVGGAPQIGSAGLGSGQLVDARLVDGAGSMPIDDLRPVPVRLADRPAGGGRTAHRARQTKLPG